MGTQGVNAAEFRDGELWWDGPPFLKESPEGWPPDITETEPSSDCLKESRKNVKYVMLKRSLLLGLLLLKRLMMLRHFGLKKHRKT